MTIKKWAINYCYERGMSEEDAEVVISNVIKSDEGQTIPWDTNIEDYPHSFKAILSVPIDAYAIEYIEKEYPLASFKDAFK